MQSCCHSEAREQNKEYKRPAAVQDGGDSLQEQLIIMFSYASVTKRLGKHNSHSIHITKRVFLLLMRAHITTSCHKKKSKSVLNTVTSGCSTFLPRSKDVTVRGKAVGVNMNVDDRFSVTDW